MGIFSRKAKDSSDVGAGQVSQPQGDGPVTLSDRTAPGGQGSPDTNQGKAEPMSPTPDHPDPLAAPELSAMSAGAAPAQLPSHPAAAALSPPGSYAGGDAGAEPMGLGGPGVAPSSDRPQVDVETSTGRADGPTGPVQHGSGEAHRAPGRDGVVPEGEQIDSDVVGGAARMGAAPPGAVAGLSSGHGETGGVPGPGDAPALGTSESQPKVEGIRLPEADRPQ